MSMSTFMGLQTALRGLLASQQEIDTTGHNIANANTPGYSRQTATLVTTTPLRQHHGLDRHGRHRAELPAGPRQLHRHPAARADDAPGLRAGAAGRTESGPVGPQRAVRQRAFIAALRILVGLAERHECAGGRRDAPGARAVRAEPRKRVQHALDPAHDCRQPDAAAAAADDEPGELDGRADRTAQPVDHRRRDDRAHPERPARQARPADRPALGAREHHRLGDGRHARPAGVARHHLRRYGARHRQHGCEPRAHLRRTDEPDLWLTRRDAGSDRQDHRSDDRLPDQLEHPRRQRSPPPRTRSTRSAST